jgi:hypothetical protein
MSRTYYESQKKPIYATRGIQSHEPELAHMTERWPYLGPPTRLSITRRGYAVQPPGTGSVASFDGAA